MSKRPPFITRTMRLTSVDVRTRAEAMLRNCPIDPGVPIEFVLREYKGKRSRDQNALYYALLSEISEQAWIEGRQYSVPILHEFVKRNMLPEDPQIEPGEVTDNYRKWDFDPAGERVLVGSTTQLTVKGFNKLLTQVECFGANLGVMFSAREYE